MAKNDKSGFWDWLGFNRTFDYDRFRWLGAGISVVLILTIGGAIVATLIQFFEAVIGWGDFANEGMDTVQAEAVRNTGLVLAALIAVPFMIWRTSIAQRQADTAEQGLITDRINKAVEGLGAVKVVKINGDETTEPNLEVRIGAIYSLERIAQDSDRDHIQIMEILCAYVRENAKQDSLTPTKNLETRETPRNDIQATIDVLGRRTQHQIDLEWKTEFRLNLNKCNLDGVDFSDGNFSAASFVLCRLEAAFFRKSALHGTWFRGSLLNYADFHRSKLIGTRFDNAVINRPLPTVGDISDSILFGEIRGISLLGADISALNYLGEPVVTNTIFGSEDTNLHDQIQSRMPDNNTLRNARQGSSSSTQAKLETIFNEKGFRHWSPYESTDLATEHLRAKFLDAMSLHGFPYR